MEVTPGVHRVEGMHGNCYIVMKDGLVLVDTGIPGTRGKILSYIRETLRRDPSEIHTILLTHFHVDHTGNAAGLRRPGKTQVAIHEGDAPYLSAEKPMPVPKVQRSIPARILRFFFRFRPVKPDTVLSNGDTIAGLTCIHTPGHTPGSACFFDQERKVLFVGDALVTPGGVIQGPVEEYSTDVALGRRSLERLVGLDFEILLSGHGEPVRPRAAGKLREYLGKK